MLAKEKIIKIIFAAVFFLPALASAQPREYQLKASFLEKFVLYTEWPVESMISDTSKPFVISVIGVNPFGNILDKMYRKDKIKNKRVEIRYISYPDEIPGCHLLFISKSMRKDISEILSITKNKAILTISEINSFAERGGHINFYVTDQETLHFEINEAMVTESGLRMHLLLIEIAKILK